MTRCLQRAVILVTNYSSSSTMRISISSLLSLSALLVSVAATESKSNVLELTQDNFDSHIGKETPALVEL